MLIYVDSCRTLVRHMGEGNLSWEQLNSAA
jgi:hypothetical protein